MDILELILILMCIMIWVYIFYQTIEITKLKIKRKRKVNKFDKIFETLFPIVYPFLEAVEMLKTYRYHRYKLYQKRLRQNTRFE